MTAKTAVASEAPATVPTATAMFGGQGPNDIPVMPGDNELKAADETSISDYTDAEYEATVDFYLMAMPDEGWTLIAEGEQEGFDLVTQRHEKEGRTAVVAITVDPASGRTLVAVSIAPP